MPRNILRMRTLQARWLLTVLLSGCLIPSGWSKENAAASDWLVLTASTLHSAKAVELNDTKQSFVVCDANGKRPQVSFQSCVALMQGEATCSSTSTRTAALKCINLVSGDRLMVSRFSLQGTHIKANHSLWGSIAIATASIASISFDSGGTGSVPKPGFVGVRLKNGDEIPGAIASASDAAIMVEMEGVGKLPVEDLSSVAHVVFRSQISGKTSDGIRLMLRTGDIVMGKLSAGKGNCWNLQSGWNQKPLPVSISEVCIVAFPGNGTFLSDMKPTRVEETPFLDRVLPYRVDASLSGSLLNVGGYRALKGLALNSRATLAFDVGRLSRKPARFACLLGIDQGIQHDKANAEFLLRVDGKLRKKLSVTAGRAPTAVHLAIPVGARSIEVTVDYGKYGSAGDHVDLLWASLVPARR